MDVGLDAAPLGVLGGDEAPAGGTKVLQPCKQLLGEADVSKDQSCLGGEVRDELVLGRGERLPRTLPDGDGPQQLTLVENGNSPVSSWHRRKPVVPQGHGCGLAFVRGPGGFGSQLSADLEPNVRPGGSCGLGEDSRHARKDVLDRGGPRHSGRELG